MKTPFIMIMTACLLTTAGCLSSQAMRDRRIQNRKEIFSKMPLQAQEQVRKGEVAIGFTEDMVRMAMGNPHRIYSRTTAAGETIIWSYVTTRDVSEAQLNTFPTTYITAEMEKYRGYEHSTVYSTKSYEYPIALIEFSDGKVSLIQKLK